MQLKAIYVAIFLEKNYERHYRKVIFKYFNIIVSDEENILDLDVTLEYWLYVFIEIEDVYDIPILNVLSHIKAEHFTLQNIEKELLTRCRFIV